MLTSTPPKRSSTADACTDLITRLWVISVLCLSADQLGAAERGNLAEFLGTWRGTSTCVDRELAPACNDETIVYEVSKSDADNEALLEAYKVVDGQRVPMGELKFVYNEKEECWRSEFTTTRVHAVWCLSITGVQMTGSLRVLPQNVDVRKVQAKHN